MSKRYRHFLGTRSELPNTRPKPMGVDEDRLSTNEQARPVPYFSGKRRIACSFLTGIFDTRKASVTVDAGKKAVRSGTSYFTSFLALVAHGPVDAIHEVILNGERVWPPTTPDSLERDTDNPDFVDITIEDYGLLRLYWGTETQTSDDYTFYKTGVRHPPYRGMCYIVAHQLFLGINQTNVQNFEVVVSRYPELGDSPAQLGNDANPANILYEILTHPRLGRGIPAELIDSDALEDLGVQLYGENIGVSPFLNTQTEADEVIETLLEYFRGYPIVSESGLLSFGTVRHDDDILGDVDETLMTEPLRVDPEDWSTTFNQTNIRFTDPDQAYDPGSKTWRDRGNFQVTGELNTQTLERTWVTSAFLADFLASALGRTYALPEASGTLMLRRTALFDDLTPGGLFTLSYPPRGYVDLRCRVIEISVPDPARPLYNVHFELDRSYLLADLSVDGVGEGGGEEAEVVDQIASYRLIELPAALAPEGKLSLSVLASKPSVLTTSFRVHLGKNYDETGLITPDSYDQVSSHSGWAFHGALVTDYSADTPTIDTEGIIIRLDSADTELPEMTTFDGLSDDLLLFINGEVLSVTYCGLVGVATYQLQVIRERFGSPREAHVTGDEAFLILRSDLLTMQHEHWQPFNTVDMKIQATSGAAAAELASAPNIVQAIDGRIYMEPALTNLRAFNTFSGIVGSGFFPTYSTGDDIDIYWTLTGDDRLPFRSDLFTQSVRLSFYDATGVTLIDTLDVVLGEFYALTNAALITILGSEVTFQLTAELVTEADWWTLSTEPTGKLLVTKI